MTEGDGSPGDGPAKATESPAATGAETDRMLVHSRSEHGYRVLRHRGDRLELGELRDPQEGRPITGEMVGLRPTEHERVFDVETVHAPPSRQGPPMVANSTYRRGWEVTFGKAEAEPSEVDPKQLN